MKNVLILVLFYFYNNINIKRKGRCNTELLNSYKLIGLKNSKKIEWVMCPLINNSCCSLEDQKWMFSYWYNGPEKYINHTFDDYIKIMDKVFDNMKMVSEFNNKMMERLKYKPMDNCKAMGTIILEYDFTEIESKYFQYLSKIKNFFLVSYKGLYCTLCDYDLQKYFNPQSMTIYVNEQFCRLLVENSIVPLIYQKNYFPKIFNIVTKLLMTCDSNGNYNKKRTLKPLYINFYDDVASIQSIISCIRSRNKSEWVSICKSICLKFKIGNISDYFFMNKRKLKYFNNMILKLITRKINYSRILETKAKIKTKTKSKLNKKPRDLKIESNMNYEEDIKPFQEYYNKVINKELFSKNSNATLTLLDFTTRDSDDGINLYANGITTIFTPSIMNQLTRYLKEKHYKMKKSNINVKNNYHRNDRGLKFAFLLKTTFVLIFFNLN